MLGGNIDQMTVLSNPDSPYSIADDTDPFDPSGYKSYPMLPRAIEHIHSKLLNAEPATTSCMNQSYNFLGKVREMFPDDAPIKNQVDSHRLLLEPPFIRGNVRKICWPAGMDAEGAGS